MTNTRAWLIWAIAAIFYLYEMVLRVSPSVMTDQLMCSFSATSTMLGVLISFYYYAYTLLQLPCGFILDRLGPRNLVGISAVLCSVGSVLFAASDYLHVAQIGRFLVGAGSACAFISCLQISAILFPRKYFPILAGATNMMGTLGGLFGGMPVAIAVNSVGWRVTTFYLALFGIAILLLVFIFIPKKIGGDHKPKAVISITQSVRKIIGNSQVILTSIVAGFMYLPISAFSELWAVPFFMSKYSINNEYASAASAILFVGVSIGSVALAFVARKINSYVKTIKMSIFATALLFLPLIFCNFSLNISMVIVFAIGVLTGAQVLNFTCAKNNGAPEISGTTLALVNGIVMLIGSIFQPILGIVLDLFWTGKISDVETRVYEVSSYQKAILTLPICLVVAYFISLFVRETIHEEE